ncbi:hypothetical protein J6590_022323 [Homalodisca vitripennis]|nr:hypothetical protein J6590_022323 [Homalodisca vitripennis]
MYAYMPEPHRSAQHAGRDAAARSPPNLVISQVLTGYYLYRISRAHAVLPDKKPGYGNSRSSSNQSGS